MSNTISTSKVQDLYLSANVVENIDIKGLSNLIYSSISNEMTALIDDCNAKIDKKVYVDSLSVESISA